MHEHELLRMFPKSFRRMAFELPCDHRVVGCLTTSALTPRPPVPISVVSIRVRCVLVLVPESNGLSRTWLPLPLWMIPEIKSRLTN